MSISIDVLIQLKVHTLAMDQWYLTEDDLVKYFEHWKTTENHPIRHLTINLNENGPNLINGLELKERIISVLGDVCQVIMNGDPFPLILSKDRVIATINITGSCFEFIVEEDQTVTIQ